VKARNLNRINKMNRMYGARQIFISDHPVDPVHPVQTLKFRSGEKARVLDRINKMNRMYEGKTDL
jgi:hypothetical protein